MRRCTGLGKAALVGIAAMLGLSSCQRAPRTITVPRDSSCPGGYVWVYRDPVGDRDVCRAVGDTLRRATRR